MSIRISTSWESRNKHVNLRSGSQILGTHKPRELWSMPTLLVTSAPASRTPTTSTQLRTPSVAFRSAIQWISIMMLWTKESQRQLTKTQWDRTLLAEPRWAARSTEPNWSVCRSNQAMMMEIRRELRTSSWDRPSRQPMISTGSERLDIHEIL